MPGRGLLTAALLIGVALGCVSIARRLECERRLLARLQARGAVDARTAVPLATFTESERQAASSLAAAGVVVLLQDRSYLVRARLGAYYRKRARLTFSGALGALLLAVLIATLLLRR
jgi:hypothetical protein